MTNQGTLTHYISDGDNTLHVEIHDNFCSSLLREFRRVCERQRYARYIIDLRNTTFLDSSALGVLIILHRFVNEDRQAVKIINVPATVRDILRTAHFHQFFDIQELQAVPLPD